MNNNKSKVQPIGISKAISYPINSQTAFSYRRGNPIISWEISPNQARLIDTDTLRFNFTLKNFGDSGQTVYTGNNDIYTGGNSFWGNALVANRVGRLNARIGVNSIIDTIRLKNFQNETIEEARNYPRNLASILPITNSKESYLNILSSKMGAMNSQIAQDRQTNMPRSYSIPLRCGIFMTGLKLNVATIGGLKIEIQLASDSMVYKNNAAGTGADVHYTLENVSLSWNYINLNAPEPPSSESIPYPAYNNYSTIINSSNDQKSLSFALQNVKQGFQNFLLSNRLNNKDYDSFATPRLKAGSALINEFNNDRYVIEYSTLRNAMKTPLKYSVDERRILIDEEHTFQGKLNAITTYDAHLNRLFLNSVRQYNKINSCLQSVYTQKLWKYSNRTAGADAWTEFPDAEIVNSLGDRKNITGIGFKYDNLNQNFGSEFSQSVFQERINSQLDGISPNSSFIGTLSAQALATKNQQVNQIR